MSLTKKEARKYKKLIHQKLDEMGVKKEFGYVDTGKKKRVYITNQDGSRQSTVVPVYRASNVYKNVTKNLLKSSISVIELFLSSPNKEANT